MIKKLNLFLSTTILKLLKKEIMYYALYQQEIKLEDLNYWNVDLQEAYFSPIEVNERVKSIKNKYYFHLLWVQIH